MFDSGNMMRTAIVVDSSCDLSEADRKSQKIELWPIDLVRDVGISPDLRDEPQTLAIFAGASALPNSSQPMDQIRARAKLMEYATRQDQLLYISVMSARSPALLQARTAAASLPLSLRTERTVRHLPEFQFHVCDSTQAFAGYAWMGAFAAQQLKNLTVAEVSKAVDAIAPIVCSYTVPDELSTIRERALKRGEKSVGLIGYVIGTALDIKPVIACRNSKTGAVARLRGFENAVSEVIDAVTGSINSNALSYPLVTIAYAGPLVRLQKISALRALKKACEGAGIMLLQSVMSITSAVNVGPGTFSIGFAANAPPLGDFSQLK